MQPCHDQKANDLVLAVCLFVFLAAAYVLTATNYMQITSDEAVNFALTESIAKFGRFDVEQMATLTREVPAEFGRDGLHYSKYGLAQALLGAPLYRLAMALPGIGLLHTALLLNALVTAAAGAFLYLTARQLGYGVGLALALAFIYGFASPVWVYTKRYMSEPLSALAFIAAAYYCLRSSRGAPTWALAGGAALAVAILNKAANLAFVPVFLAYLFWAGSSAEPAGAAERPHRSSVRVDSWRRLLLCALPVGLGAAAFAYYNWLRFGDPLHTGYGPQEGFSVPLWEGLAGLLFSPGKSAFIYFPLLLLVVAWAPKFLRRQRAAGLLCLGLLAGHFLLYATWWIWWGGWNWGVRFLIPAWAFAVLLLGEGLRGLRGAASGTRRWVALFVVLLVLSVGVQVLGVLVDHSVYLASLLPLTPDPDRLTLNDLSRQPLLNQLRYLSPAYWDFGWLLPGENRQADVTALAGLLAGLLAAGLALAWAYRRRGRGRQCLGALLVAGLVVMGGAYHHLERAYARDDRSAAEIVAHLRERAAERSTLIYLAPRYLPLYANVAKVAIPTWGQHEESPLKPATQARLERLAATYDEIWLISEYAPAAPENGIERWLAANTFRESERWFGPFRLAGYRTGTGRATGYRPLGISLGPSVQLLGYAVADPERARRPGETVEVTLRWQASGHPAQDYTVFVHLLDEQEKVWGQQDVQPGAGFAPTSGWQPGQVLDDRYAVPVHANAPSGTYRLEVGMYLAATGERLPVRDGEGRDLGNRILLPTTVQVAPP